MTQQLLASKIVFQEEEPRVTAIAPAATAIAGVVGLAERGPIGVATLVQSFPEFVRVFGNFGPNYDLPLAALEFFGEGGDGQQLWVVRTAHYATPNDATSVTATTGTITALDTAVSPVARARFTGKTPGAYVNTLTIEIDAPTNGAATSNNVLVLKAGRPVESFSNVSVLATDPDYFVTRINDPNTGSQLIVAADLSPAGTHSLALATVTPTGGNDGLAGLADADFIGNAAASSGLRALDHVDDLALLPNSGRATAAYQNAMVTYCEATRFGTVFPVLDPPAGLTAAQARTYFVDTAGLKELSEFGAAYWPRIRIANPDPTVFGSSPWLLVPPSAAIAGLYARNDGKAGGVYEAPAGVDQGYGVLRTAIGLETDEVRDEGKRDLIYPDNINPIVGIRGQPIHLDGAKCLKTSGNFPTIGERRGVIFIEQSLRRGLFFAKHRKIKASTLARMQRVSNAFLLGQTRLGAFASDVPSEAYSIDFGAGLNPPSEAQALRLNGRYGIATAKPAEFIVLRAGQDTRALEAELTQANQ